MSVAADKAASIQGPIAAADATGLTGVMRVAMTGSSQSVAIPTELRGKYVDLYCTVEAQYAFGTGAAAPTIVTDQAAALGTGHASAGKTLPAGIDKSVLVPTNATFIAWKGASGFIELVCSEARNVQ
jgi:hypothetical protein